LAIQADSGTLTIDAIDAFDGTPVLDIKPWLASVDIPPGFRA
jgi:tRNA (Thr-GGU) A37 N-methylase